MIQRALSLSLVEARIRDWILFRNCTYVSVFTAIFFLISVPIQLAIPRLRHLNQNDEVPSLWNLVDDELSSATNAIPDIPNEVVLKLEIVDRKFLTES